MDYSKIINSLKTEFQNNKGRGYCYLYKPIETHIIIYDILVSLINKKSDIKILIATESYTQVTDFKELFKNSDKGEDYFKNVNIISHPYLKYNNPYNKEDNTPKYNCFISVGINDDDETLLKFIAVCKFCLIVLSKNIMDNRFITSLNAKIPFLKVDNNAQGLFYQKIYTPVEEYRHKTYLSEEDRELYNKYDNYIKDSISIFGDMDTIQKCRVGNAELGMSAMDCCYEIAKRNGWDYTIDKTLDYNQKLDEVFNPIALRDRINNIFVITNNRKKLITDNKCKLETIKDIVENNMDKRILIISARGEFAYTIQKYLEDNNIKTVGGYHDELPDSYMQDINGQVITYKSGEHKGEPKLFKSQALSTNYENLYNQNYINILSIKAASSNKLSINVDIVILTTTLIDTFFNIKTRFNDINFANPNIIHRIYISDTTEEKSLLNEKPNSLINIHEENFAENMEIDAISGDINL